MISEEVKEKWVNKLKALLSEWRDTCSYYEGITCYGKVEKKIHKAIAIIEAEEIGDSWADE